jgi:AMMECR1 domain-containing protein
VDHANLRTAVVAALADVESLSVKLTGLLAELDGTDTAIDLGRQGLWTKAQIALLWGKVNHLPGVRALFEATAARPDEKVTFTELLERSGLPERQQSNEHAALSRISAQLFKEKRWPIENIQGGSDSATGKAEMLYWMDRRVAEWWRAITQ